MIHSIVKDKIGQILEEEFIFPKDILVAIRSNHLAWEHYQSYSLAYQRIRVAFIEGVRKRPEIFSKRLKYFIKKTEAISNMAMTALKNISNPHLLYT
jgi:hypothetical protein